MLEPRLRAGALGLAALFLGFLLAQGIVPVLGGGPSERVVPAEIQLRPSGVEAAPNGDAAGGAARDRSDQSELVTLAVTGRLERCGDEYCLNGNEVDFGPPWYLRKARAPMDHDRDGVVETLALEIRGLVGVTVTLTVERGRRGDLDVFSIDGVFYRDEIGPPPWAGGPPWVPGPPPRGEAPPSWAPPVEGEVRVKVSVEAAPLDRKVERSVPPFRGEV